MADYYSEFSCAFYAPAEVLDVLEAKLKAAEGDDVEDDERLYGVEYSRQKDAEGEFMWMHGYEPNLEALAGVIAELQEDLQLDSPWGFQYSNSCSKPRLDAYGGGACFIHRGEQEWFNTGRWLDEKMTEAQ